MRSRRWPIYHDCATHLKQHGYLTIGEELAFDFCDLVVLNKFDRPGAEDALTEIRESNSSAIERCGMQRMRIYQLYRLSLVSLPMLVSIYFGRN